ncbi:cystathionine beta-synthase [Rhodococcoides trifolii]|uniref:cysteine synthase n=1 Tax=Rhodococcoides trifolii TaxID=908250 RepID=A0A917FPZ8_9NOCA|nr:cystathionine beta-synthase [Rhodococcus trifolii]
MYESVADAIGHTPLVRLRRVAQGIDAAVYAKLEFLNPGGSVKDRAAVSMIDAAERDGSLRTGGTVVEGTSGNTGIGLTMVAASRGYHSIVVVPDKTSTEKIATLRAHGADVRVVSGARPTQHPEHVRNLAARIAAETPGGWLAGQYDNPANPDAHYRTTGPEIWQQTGGRITHFVAGIGTGGTVTGAGRFLKEASAGQVRVIGADPETSSYGGGDGRAFYIESVGHFVHPESIEDTWPASYDPTVLDTVERISDQESIDVVRDVARRDGLLIGGSSGTAVAAALRVARTLPADSMVVVILPDSGRSYVSKYFDPEWLQRFGFDGVAAPVAAEGPRAVRSTATIGEAREALGNRPTLPVVLGRAKLEPVVAAEIVGAIHLAHVADAPADDPITDYISAALPLVGSGDSSGVVVHGGRVVDVR